MAATIPCRKVYKFRMATHMRDFNSAKNVKSEGLKIVAAGYWRR